MDDLEIHNMTECEECNKSMKAEGKGCKVWQREVDADDNFITNVLEMERIMRGLK